MNELDSLYERNYKFKPTIMFDQRDQHSQPSFFRLATTRFQKINACKCY